MKGHPTATQRWVHISLGRRYFGCGRSKRSEVLDSFGKKVLLDSTYELEVSELLNQLGIRWIRPKPLSWYLEGKQHLYHPDFFLTDFNLYLDPKNDYLARIDVGKISLVSWQNAVVIRILTKKQITLEYLKGLVAPENFEISTYRV